MAKSDTELLDGVLDALSRHGWNADRGNLEAVCQVVLEDLRDLRLRVEVVRGLASPESCFVDGETLKAMKESLVPAMGSLEAQLDD